MIISAKGADMDVEGLFQSMFSADKFCTRLSIQDSRPDPNSPWYNRQRLHQTLDYQSPEQFERMKNVA